MILDLNFKHTRSLTTQQSFFIMIFHELNFILVQAMRIWRCLRRNRLGALFKIGTLQINFRSDNKMGSFSGICCVLYANPIFFRSNVRSVFEGLLDLFTVFVQFFTSMMSPIALFKFTYCFVILKVYLLLNPLAAGRKS